MVTVDLNTKVLPQNHGVYMVRPGTGYHLLSAFNEHRVIAPDLAFLNVPNGERPRDFENMEAQVKRARAFAEWVKTEDTRAAPMPSRVLEDYNDKEAPSRITMYRNTADEILYSLPEGALIFVPNPVFTEKAMIGELAGADEERLIFNGTSHWGELEYQGRRLKNVKMLPMRKLPKAFFPPMKKRNWIHQYVGREKELLYRQFYGDFEIVGRKAVTEIEVTGQRVFPQDLSIIGALTTLIDQKLARQAAGDQDALDLLQAVFLPPDQNEAPVIHANLGSSGNVLVESVTRRAAPVLKVIVILALGYTGGEIWDMVQTDSLVLSNSQALAGTDAENLAETQQMTYDFVRSTGRESLEQIVGLVRDFHDRTGGNVDATVIADD
ncbi:hypothetical protein Q4494_00850 [Celeribacter halophilus]|uniref:DUF4055 domain-containing protein n=1 Tax=Celeribacter halophilus TaxID=576117 RepID=A0AAW7XPD8_9RHOB|nr:hypothetical protein [Celeribacter halophilus]MDO6455611.1 hypothetical protein [Celeribacter halophilus]